MSADLTITQGDSTPVLTATITDQNGNPVNLTSATVTFVMRLGSATAPAVNAAATILSATAGTVQYSWATEDTATVGLYAAQFRCTLSGGATYTYPNQGFLDIEIQPNLAGASQQLVSIADAKDVLNFQSTDRIHDTKILRWINAAQDVFEQRCGPIVVQNFDEWYDGGQYQIMLRHTPSTALGSSAVCVLNFVEVYIGPIEYQFTGVGNPVTGSIYTYEVDTFSRVIRRGPGGGIIPFPNMPQSVHIGYTAGQSVIPDNVYEAVLEYLREMYQQTAQSTSQGWGNGSEGHVPDPIVGFALSGRVLGILGLSRKAPAVF